MSMKLLDLAQEEEKERRDEDDKFKNFKKMTLSALKAGLRKCQRSDLAL